MPKASRRAALATIRRARQRAGGFAHPGVRVTAVWPPGWPLPTQNYPWPSAPRFGCFSGSAGDFRASTVVRPETGDGSMRTGGTVVIGAGPGGLASAAELRRRGVPAVVLERADAVGASWRGRYDRLRLNTSRWFSKLPGGRYAPRHGRLPVPRRGRRLPRGLRARQRPRRAPAHAAWSASTPTAPAGSCARRQATSPPST